jgi:ribonuclease P protein component
VRRYDSLRGRREFALVLRRGRTAGTKHLSVYALGTARRDPRPKVGIVITKKVGNAVVRNRLRRRCKSILDASSAVADGTWFVVLCRPTATELAFPQLREELDSALQASARRAGQAAPAREVRRR